MAEDVRLGHHYSHGTRLWWVVAAGVLAFLLHRHRVWFAVAISTLLGVCLICSERDDDVIHSARSFFGVLRVLAGDRGTEEEPEPYHTLMHGSTMHGQQSWSATRTTNPAARPSSPGRIIIVPDRWARCSRPWKCATRFARHGHIGVVGLGTGSIAAYANRGQTITYFEIDWAVRRISEDPQYFTYLTDCRNRGATLDFRMGDARLTLAREPDGEFDVLLVDAFSSDAIPVHLLTRTRRWKCTCGNWPRADC